MNIRNYLEAKYGVRNATTIMNCEARVFGIRIPLQHGWLNEHGETEITADTVRSTCNQQKYTKHPIDFMQSRGFLL